MKTALHLDSRLWGRHGSEQHHYLLNPPYDGIKYVIVATIITPPMGPETFIFRSDERFRVITWHELPGSYRGGTDRDKALAGLGYEVAR